MFRVCRVWEPLFSLCVLVARKGCGNKCISNSGNGPTLGGGDAAFRLGIAASVSLCVHVIEPTCD